MPFDAQEGETRTNARFLRLLLVAALAAAIAAAAILRRDLQNNQIPRSIDALLKASYVLGLGEYCVTPS
jgi:hypothetical protein